MARRKAVPPPSPDAGLPILPRHIVDHPRLSSAELREISDERLAWFQAKGVDAGDWSKVYPIILASWKAHGIPSALDRARSRLEPKDTDR